MYQGPAVNPQHAFGKSATVLVLGIMCVSVCRSDITHRVTVCVFFTLQVNIWNMVRIYIHSFLLGFCQLRCENLITSMLSISLCSVELLEAPTPWLRTVSNVTESLMWTLRQ